MAANMGRTAPDDDWLCKGDEPVLEPDLAISSTPIITCGCATAIPI
jgi:hypothetical protein